MAASLPVTGAAIASGPAITVYREPSCGCCGGWVRHLQQEGFQVSDNILPTLSGIRSVLAIPDDLLSCHTARIDGYIIEGHVPAVAIRRLLAQRPALTGLSAPNMPANSPGMEIPGQAAEPYDIIGFGPGVRLTFMRCIGANEA